MGERRRRKYYNKLRGEKEKRINSINSGWGEGEDNKPNKLRWEKEKRINSINLCGGRRRRE